MTPPLLAIDLFSGVGGMSLGFERAGFNVAAAFDFDQTNVATYAQNFPGTEVRRVDLSAVSGNELRAIGRIGRKHVHVVFGGPPCQGLSVGGKRAADDPRNLLLLDFARLVSEISPSYFVLENVDGLLGGIGADLLEAFLTLVRSGGYEVCWPLACLDSSEFGVPQRRRRAFILGAKAGLSVPEYPVPQARAFTVWDAISDLPLIERLPNLLASDIFEGQLGAPSEYVTGLRRDRRGKPLLAGSVITGCRRVIHSPDVIARFRDVSPGEREPISRFLKLSKAGLCPTLRAGTLCDHGRHTAPRPIHPIEPRVITTREAARLHSFPDWFEFSPSKWRGFMQIGNSVPPLLAQAVAEVIARSIHTLSPLASSSSV